MPLFIRALPLSFPTFWRYALNLPLLVLLALLVLPLSLLPLVGTLIPGAIGAALTLIGLRCALAARGYGRVWELPGIAGLALAYSVIIILGGWIAKMVWAGLGWLVLTAANVPDAVALEGLVYQRTPFAVVFWLFALLPQLLLASVLTVPMTAAAAARDWREGGLVSGLGVGMLGLSVPLLAWMGLGNIWAFFGEIKLISFAIIYAWVDFERMVGLFKALLSNPFFLFSLIGMIWASSWFFATAVLYWERMVQQDRSSQSARTAAKRVSSDDIRALRLERERMNRERS